jgi:hypothetical protein
VESHLRCRRLLFDNLVNLIRLLFDNLVNLIGRIIGELRKLQDNSIGFVHFDLLLTLLFLLSFLK